MRLLTASSALLGLAPAVCGFMLPDVVHGLAPQNPLKLRPETPDFRPHDSLAPILNIDNVETTVPDKYIVVLNDDLSEADLAAHTAWIARRYAAERTAIAADASASAILRQRLLNHELEHFDVHGVFRGYSGYFTAELVRLIQAAPLVKYLEKDTKVTISEFDIQKDAPWALARLSSRPLPVKSDYLYDNDGGKGVTAYVVDTGIKVSHEEFEGRASWGESVAFPKLKVDGNGHGTHCAGIIGSKTFGVAKSVDLVAVGVMNLLGSGTTTDIIKGIEFVVNDHRAKAAARPKGFKGSVINMSLGGAAQESLDLAINAAVAAGVHVAVAAGNDNEDACNYSPAKAKGPLTVGATNVQDARASFSNWGGCVDVFAPGEDILSTYIYGDTASLSGTSMASPHVAGLLAYFLSLQPDITSEYANGLLPPALLKDKVIKYATKSVLSGIEDSQSPNLLIHNGAGGNLTDFWGL